MSHLQDAALKNTTALPNGAAAVNGGGFDLGLPSSRGEFHADVQLEIVAPALVTADLPDTKTMIYKVQHDSAADFGSAVTLYDAVITQTGAGGAGAAAQTKKARLPSDVSRYVRVVATNDGTGDASDKSMIARLIY